MDKAKKLRQALETALTTLKKNPDNLVMFIDDGDVYCSQGESVSFKYKYKLTTVVLNYTQHPDTLFIPLIQWLAINEPSLLRADETPAITFEAEAINHTTTDIVFSLTLTEPVIVNINPEEGTYTAHHVECPPITDVTGPTDWTLFVNGVEYEPEPESA